MGMRKQWACPDLGEKKPPGMFLPIPGSLHEGFDDCPAYYLRVPGMDLPAAHLIDGALHPAQDVSQWAFEIETGSRNIETLSPRARELVHLYIREKVSRDEYAREKRKR